MESMFFTVRLDLKTVRWFCSCTDFPHLRSSTANLYLGEVACVQELYLSVGKVLPVTFGSRRDKERIERPPDREQRWLMGSDWKPTSRMLQFGCARFSPQPAQDDDLTGLHDQN
jgi:hypothetical protein